jgi:HK97 family phage portal protein
VKFQIPFLSGYIKAQAATSFSEWLQAFFRGDEWALAASTNAGVAVTEESSMQCMAVYGCVHIISETIASLSFLLYKKQDRGKVEAVNHPLYPILHDLPNPEMTAMTFWEQIVVSVLLWGNGYAQIVRNGDGQIMSLWPLIPSRMRVTRDKDTGAVTYSYQMADGTWQNIPYEQIFHVPGLGFNGITGFSPIRMAKNAIGLAQAAEQYGSSFFSNGACPAGILSHPSVLKDPDKMKKNWNDANHGPGKARGVAILEEGMTYSQIGIPPEDSQFMETRSYQVADIARLYRVPLHLLAEGDKAATYASVEQFGIQFVTYTLLPWCRRIEETVYKELLNPTERKKYFGKLNVKDLLRGDFATRMTGYTSGRQNGWFTTNDIREMEDMDLSDDPAADEFLVNGNMISISTAAAQLPKQTPAPVPPKAPGTPADTTGGEEDEKENL